MRKASATLMGTRWTVWRRRPRPQQIFATASPAAATAAASQRTAWPVAPAPATVISTPRATHWTVSVCRLLSGPSRGQVRCLLAATHSESMRSHSVDLHLSRAPPADCVGPGADDPVGLNLQGQGIVTCPQFAAANGCGQHQQADAACACSCPHLEMPDCPADEATVTVGSTSATCAAIVALNGEAIRARLSICRSFAFCS